MKSIKPTADDAVAYLSSRTDDRKFFHKDGIIYEQFEGHGASPFAFVDEIHWLKNGIVGARGYPLWFVDMMEGEEPSQPKVIVSKRKKEDPSPTSKISKFNMAIGIVRDNLTESPKNVLQMVREMCDMSEAGARTYVSNAKKVLRQQGVNC